MSTTAIRRRRLLDLRPLKGMSIAPSPADVGTLAAPGPTWAALAASPAASLDWHRQCCDDAAAIGARIVKISCEAPGATQYATYSLDEMFAALTAIFRMCQSRGLLVHYSPQVSIDDQAGIATYSASNYANFVEMAGITAAFAATFGGLVAMIDVKGEWNGRLVDTARFPNGYADQLPVVQRAIDACHAAAPQIPASFSVTLVARGPGNGSDAWPGIAGYGGANPDRIDLHHYCASPAPSDLATVRSLAPGVPIYLGEYGGPLHGTTGIAGGEAGNESNTGGGDDAAMVAYAAGHATILAQSDVVGGDRWNAASQDVVGHSEDYGVYPSIVDGTRASGYRLGTARPLTAAAYAALPGRRPNTRRLALR